MKPIKVIFAMLIILACTAAFFVATPRIAQAAHLQSGWFFEDDMENGWAPWECWEPPRSNCYRVSTSANDYFVLDTFNSLATVGRKVTISPFDSDMSCKATMFIKPESGSAPFSGQLEVIDYNTWNYIKIKTFTYIYVPFNGGWNTVTTTSWTPPDPDIFVRTVFNNPTTNDKELQVDLLRVSCTW